MTVFSTSARFNGWKEVVGTIVIMERQLEVIIVDDGNLSDAAAAGDDVDDGDDVNDGDDDVDDVDLSRGGSQQRLALQVAHLTSVGLPTITMRRRMTTTMTRTMMGTMMMIIPPEPPPSPRKAAVFPSTALHSEIPS